MSHATDDTMMPRPAFIGFSGALALVAIDGLFEAVTAPAPPLVCPVCCRPCMFAKRDDNNDWTWNCEGGCNP